MDNITFSVRICSELRTLSATKFSTLLTILSSLFAFNRWLVGAYSWSQQQHRQNQINKHTHKHTHTLSTHTQIYTYIYTSKRQSYMSYRMNNSHAYIHVNIFSYILKLARAQQRWAQKTLNYPDEKAWGTMKFVELSTKLCVETKCGMIREKSAPIGAWKCNFPSF